MTENIVEAGSLTSDHIGATVSVTWKDGKITSTVTDRLTQFTNEGSLVTLHFKNTPFRASLSLLSTPPESGLRVGFRTPVTIEEVSA
ncbi:hypothetical protein NS183_07865 [Microbacterium testaceum]|uniref:hypothetical protein n=1 Tax=Microbacterium testaceum TaxID=2033 RepID=UPI0007340854|nr:hypothetical protein [Microbacterium testaceum]KTS90690.1 hypothetical protein NS183_07865 [Microbacterium testaceum]